jgi:hypothetical protein
MTSTQPAMSAQSASSLVSSPLPTLAYPPLAPASAWQPRSSGSASRRAPRMPPPPSEDQGAATGGPRRVGDIMPDVLARYGLRMPALRPR